MHILPLLFVPAGAVVVEVHMHMYSFFYLCVPVSVVIVAIVKVVGKHHKHMFMACTDGLPYNLMPPSLMTDQRTTSSFHFVA
jgi:hypothetical protein